MHSFDDSKDSLNQQKHNISLAEAANFDWDTALIEEDRTEDYGEQRERAIGFIGEKLYVYVYTMRDDEDRPISLRAADKRERKHYENHIRETFGFG